jgi:pimeloyl-ACP methyl ester carboxylesterase
MDGGGKAGIEATSVFVTAPDGLKLHVRCYGPRLAPNLPVVCLPGLTRTVADFEELAALLVSDSQPPRRVLALDSRGRGLSEYDRNPLNYSLVTELADLRAVLIALDVAPAVFVGTSRGGILTMLLGSAQPTAVAGAVLNDIGPVIEPTGLARIKSYVGKLPRLKSYEEGAAIFRRIFGPQFPKLTDQDWLAYARRSFKAEKRRLVPSYDVRLAKTMEGINFDQPVPPLWGAFDSLGRVPLMVVRGQNSDLLSEQTVAAMQTRRPEMEIVTVPDQGHAPILSGGDLLGRIAAFVASCEPARQG